jgi:hypothetical protein
MQRGNRLFGAHIIPAGAGSLGGMAARERMDKTAKNRPRTLLDTLFKGSYRASRLIRGREAISLQKRNGIRPQSPDLSWSLKIDCSICRDGPAFMKVQHLFSVIGTALLVGCSPASQKSTSGDKPNHHAPDAAIVAKLQEIVEVRQELLKLHQRMLEAGVTQDDGAAELALAEARMQLARERGQSELVRAELRNIVTTHERRLELAKARAAVGGQTAADIERVRVALLEAEVRLQREQREVTRQ